MDIKEPSRESGLLRHKEHLNRIESVSPQKVAAQSEEISVSEFMQQENATAVSQNFSGSRGSGISFAPRGAEVIELGENSGHGTSEGGKESRIEDAEALNDGEIRHSATLLDSKNFFTRGQTVLTTTVTPEEVRNSLSSEQDEPGKKGPNQPEGRQLGDNEVVDLSPRGAPPAIVIDMRCSLYARSRFF
jgi:hypothetical protein